MALLVLALLAASPLPNYDRLASEPANRSLPRLSERDLARALPGVASEQEGRLGVPSFYWSALPEQPLHWREAGVTAEQAARRHLFSHAALYRFLPGELAQAQAFRTWDTGKGAVVVSFRRVVNGVPLYREAMHVVMTHDFALVALSGWLNAQPAPLHPGGAKEGGEPFALSATTALSVAVQDLGFGWLDPALTAGGLEGPGGWQALASPSFRVRDARARRVWYGLPARLVAAWQVEWELQRDDGRAELYTHVVSAEDGQLLTRLSMGASANPYRVWADPSAPFQPFDGPQGNDYSPNPTGTLTGVQAPVGPSALVSVDQAFGADPWLPASPSGLSGNNAFAYADLVPPDGLNDADAGEPAGDLQVPPSGAGGFDYAYDLNADTGATPTQHFASATQAFFTVNWAHDWLYGAGFDEKAGNAQASNLTRGGLEGDPVKVEVHDWAGLNDTRSVVPADGKSPKLEFYPYFAGGPSMVYLDDAGSVAGPALFGPQSFTLSAPVVRGYDLDGGYNGCDPIADRAGTDGKIVLYDRVGCGYYAAAVQAADAGAVGVLITYSQDQVVQMNGPPDFTGVPPTQQMSHDAGTLLALELDAGLTPVVVMSRGNLPQRDSALDSSLVVHEYGHVLSGRLVSDGQGLINTMGIGMGEGWSDFLALLSLVRAADAQATSNVNWQGAFAIGAFANSGYQWTGAGNASYYLGVRRYPYSADQAKNALSFRHIQDGVPLPATPGAAFGNNSEPHNVGEVWASALWDGYVAMLTSPRHTYAEASALTLGYLVAGLEATPPTPTFLEGRDALLSVVAASDPQDFTLFLGAFAGRGMGLAARAPDRFATDNKPVVEDATTNATGLRVTKVTLDDRPWYCDGDGLLDEGETGTVTVEVLNTGLPTLSSTTVDLSSPFAGLTFPDGAHLTLPPMATFHTATASARVSLSGATDVVHLLVNVDATDPLLNGGIQKSSWNFLANADAQPGFTEKVEASAADWTWDFLGQQEAGIEFGWSPQELAAYDPAFVGTDVPFGADSSLESPPFDVTGPLVITFKQAWSLEVFNGNDYDGGLLELSTDGGRTWTPIPPSALSVPYNGNVFANANSPIAGSLAFVGASAGYPAWVNETVDLGTAYVGQQVRFRFRLVTDTSGAAQGWAFDDFTVAGVASPPFKTWVKDTAACVQRPPRVDAGKDFDVDERTLATLPGVVTDPDGDAFTLTWSQTAGPTVALSSTTQPQPTFTAPEVTQDTQLTFHLSASDGTHSASDDVNVTVHNVNRKPVVTATAKDKVSSEEKVTLTAVASDPDGDALHLTWSQVSGPTVSLSDPSVASPTFTAPKVDKTGSLTFQVVANDGVLDSDPATVTVNVAPKGCGCGSGGGPALGALLLLAQLLRRRRDVRAR